MDHTATPFDISLAEWMNRFLDSITVAKPSDHTVTAYRRDLAAVTDALAANLKLSASELKPDAVNVSSLRSAFATYARPRSAATVRRAWSAWNRFCGFLLTEGVIAGNPMQAIARPKASKSLARALPDDAVKRLIATLSDSVGTHGRADDWPERDFAIITLTLLCGLRSAELRSLNIGDIQPHSDAENELRIHVRGKGRKDRIVHASPPLTAILDDYLTTRAARFGASGCAPIDAPTRARFRDTDPLFINRDGARLTQGTLQYRVQRAYRNAGIESDRTKGALTHALRHTFATTMANRPGITIHTLAKMLGHESIATTQRYTEGAGAITREAAAANPHYGLLDERQAQGYRV